MIETGVVRRMDEFGRITIPSFVRKLAFGGANIEGCMMKILYEKDGTIILEPYVPVTQMSDDKSVI